MGLRDVRTPEQIAHATVTWLLAGQARGEAVDAVRWETAIVASIVEALEAQREAIARAVEASPGKSAAELAAIIRAGGKT